MQSDPDATRPDVELGPAREGSAQPGGTGHPVDHAHEVPALAALKRRGFTAEFVVEGDSLRIVGTDRRLRPEQLRIVDHYRFEGTSDPDDMSVIYALEARDGTRGIVTDAFGGYADPAVGAVLDRIRVARPPSPRPWRRVLIPVALGALAGAAAVVVARRARAA